MSGDAPRSGSTRSPRPHGLLPNELDVIDGARVKERRGPSARAMLDIGYLSCYHSLSRWCAPCSSPSPVFPALNRALAAASHSGFRILQFSVQDDHVHLIVEADDSRALRRGLRGLAIRAAPAVNRALKRRGPVWKDRYHARELTTPRAVRHALVYVLMNIRKHRGGGIGLDPCSSAVFLRRMAGTCRGTIHAGARRPPAHLVGSRRLAPARPRRAG